MPSHTYIRTLLHCIELEEKEQARLYRLDAEQSGGTHSLRALKAGGLVLHPIIVTRKTFGYADYPEISFRLPYPEESTLFRDGAAIECFRAGMEPVKGVLIGLDGRTGEFRLFAPDFPEWLEDDGVGIKLAPDTRTTGIMKKVLRELEANKPLYRLFEQLHGESPVPATALSPETAMPGIYNLSLNESQRRAVAAVLHNESMVIVHGPPGTGKTTTLVEAIRHLIAGGEKVLVTAPSNAAVDNIAGALLKQGVRLLRVGNTSKVDETIFPHTPEGKLSGSREQNEIRQLKIQAESFRKMALKYKRSFGKAEREQRNLLFAEVKSIRETIRKLQAYNEEKLFADADVIAGTPIGLYDAGIRHIRFGTLVMDEAGQCLEPLAWCVFPMAERIVLAGDHWQLPPTVLSQEAVKLGFNRSILEAAVAHKQNVYLLNIQYRMRPAIAGFSSRYFYGGMLQTAGPLADAGAHIYFVDTAGAGYQESHGNDGSSLQNEGELRLAMQILQRLALPAAQTAFVSPYAGQVAAAKEILPAEMRVSTIDSFQGQEMEHVIVSLIRGNDECEIGFLKDYRRMNVAITRAKNCLVVIGDSATIGSDAFYRAFLEYVEEKGHYLSVWEFEL